MLCFVEFADARCAATALEALQGMDDANVAPYPLIRSPLAVSVRHPRECYVSSYL